MAFSKNIRNARLEYTSLIADCCTSTSDWQQSVLDLNRAIGNDRGTFRWNGQNFSQSARDVRLEGSMLYAQLATGDDVTWLDSSLDLDECIINQDGHLRFRSDPGPGNAVLDSCVLRADYFPSGADGECRQTFLDLDEYLGNNEGEFQVEGRDFSHSATNVRLEGSVLHARLATSQGEWFDDSLDLDDWIGNNDGRLHWKEESEIGWEIHHYGDHDGMLIRWSPPHFINENERRERDNTEAEAQNRRRHVPVQDTPRCSCYAHTALATATSIRLLKIEPAARDHDAITCSIVEVDLDDYPSYTALSYTWGSPFPPTIPSIEEQYQQTTTVQCNGENLQVKQNLYDALRRLRQKATAQESPAPPDKTDLISAVQSGSLLKVEDTLRGGADVGMRDSSGRTALHWAAKLGHLDITKALIVAGSDIDAECDSNKKPLDYAKSGYGPFVKSIEDFLVEHKNSSITVNKENTSLRLDVTDTDWFWIDAICINQDDEKEKAGQVAIMGNIYRSAKHVIVWLGREYHDYQDNTEQLLQGSWRLELAREGTSIPKDTLERLISDPVKSFQGVKDSKIMYTAIDWLNTVGLNTIETWFIVPHLFQRTWFDRAWILQEVVMAKDLTVVCGPYVLPWDVFLLMSSIVECCRRLLGTAGIDTVFTTSKWGELYETQLKRGARSLSLRTEREEVPSLHLAQWRTVYQLGGQLSMVAALSLSRNQESTNARDKVFCVLAFSPIERMTRRGLRKILPDYALSPGWLYIEAGKCLLAAYGSCILSLGGLDRCAQINGLPTWVPDLNSPLRGRVRGIDVAQVHDTHSLISPIAPHNLDIAFDNLNLEVTSQNELLMRGCFWDTIAETAHSGLNDVGIDLSGLHRWLELLSKMHPTPERKRSVLLRTLAELPDDGNDHDGNFRDWLKFLSFSSIMGHQQTLRAKGLSFEEYDIYAHKDLERPEDKLDHLIEQAQTHFAALGFELTDDEISQWEGQETWDEDDYDYDHMKYLIWYASMITDAMDYGHIIRDNDPSRRLLRTEKSNMLGTSPEEAQANDSIVLIDGASVPYVLRKVEDGKYQLIGEAYVHGMDVGEQLKDARVRREMESICIV